MSDTRKGWLTRKPNEYDNRKGEGFNQAYSERELIVFDAMEVRMNVLCCSFSC